MEENKEHTENQVNNAILEVIMDVNTENKKIIKRQTKVIVLLICLLFASFVYYEWSFKAFMSQYDYENVITETNAKNNNKTFDKNSPISANISNINVNADKK